MADEKKSDTPPAEVPETDGGWWGSVWNSVREATEKVVEVYKEDLAEFAGNISTDTERAVEEVKRSEMLERVRAKSAESAQYLVDNLVDGLADESIEAIKAPTNRLEQKLLELQSDMGTYCTVPTGDDWSTFEFVAVDREKEIIALLADSPVLAANYNKIVPTIASYEDFWKRYLYREHKLRERERERQELIQKASEVASSQPQDLTWEDDDFDDDNDDDDDDDGTSGLNIDPVTPHGGRNDGASFANNSDSFSSVVLTPAATETDDLLLDGWDDDGGDTNNTTINTSNDDALSLATPEILSQISTVTKTPAAKESVDESSSSAGLNSVEVIDDWGGWE